MKVSFLNFILKKLFAKFLMNVANVTIIWSKAVSVKPIAKPLNCKWCLPTLESRDWIKKKYAFRNYAWQNWDIFFGLQTFLVNLRKDLEETKEKWNRIWKFRYFQERFISFWKYWRFILQVNEYIYLICFQTGSYYCCFDWYSGCELSCDCAQDFNWCVKFLFGLVILRKNYTEISMMGDI